MLAQSRPSHRPHTSGQPQIRPAWRSLSALGGSGMLGYGYGCSSLSWVYPDKQMVCTVLDAAVAVPVSRHAPEGGGQANTCQAAVSAGSPKWASLITFARRVDPDGSHGYPGYERLSVPLNP